MLRKPKSNVPIMLVKGMAAATPSPSLMLRNSRRKVPSDPVGTTRTNSQPRRRRTRR